MEAACLLQRIFPCSGALARFAALGGARPRWIVPVGKPQIAPLLATWHPYKHSSRLGWRAVCWAARVDALHRLPGVTTFTARMDGINWRNFGWQGSAPPLAAFYVGTRGPQQKLVAMLAEAERGAPRLIVKFPLGLDAWSAIAHEYATLRELAADGRTDTPAPLHIDPDNRFAAQSWLDGASVGAGLTQAHIAFLASLKQPEKKIALEGIRATFLEERARLIAAGALSSSAVAETELLLANGDWHGTVPAVRVHGDFAPWNLKRLGNGAIAAVDWEESAREGLPFYDLHYYQLQVKRLLGRRVNIPFSAYEAALFGETGMEKPVGDTASSAARAAAAMALSGAVSRVSDE